jgi:hypothetical protein
MEPAGTEPGHLNRRVTVFAALVLAQLAHSIEEYVGRLWESFPPARFLTSLVSENGERGFLVLNLALVGFGFWCLLVPVRLGWPSAVALTWAWVGIELVNGIGHPLWSLRQGGYTPGVATAPLLLVLALWLAREVRHGRPPGSAGSEEPVSRG